METPLVTRQTVERQVKLAAENAREEGLEEARLRVGRGQMAILLAEASKARALWSQIQEGKIDLSEEERMIIGAFAEGMGMITRTVQDQFGICGGEDFGEGFGDLVEFDPERHQGEYTRGDKVIIIRAGTYNSDGIQINRPLTGKTPINYEQMARQYLLKKASEGKKSPESP